MTQLLKEKTKSLCLTPRQAGEKMHVCFCIDRNYVQHAGAAITSIAINNHGVNVEFHIVCNTLENSDLEKLSSLADIYGRSIHLYFIDESFFADVGIDADLSYISLATYYRLVIPSVLPEDLDKVLYLDADTICESSLLDLWFTNIDDFPLAAWGLCREEFENKSNLTDREKGFKEFLEKRIGEIDLKSGSYCNAGVMLMNLEIWHRDSISSKAIEFIKDAKPRFMDQDGINKVIDGNFHFLEKKWNYPIRLNWYDSTLPEDTAILHFVSSSKPWHKGSDPRRQIYWKYVQRSPWSDKYRDREKTLEELLTEIASSNIHEIAKKARHLSKLMRKPWN
jgi:UDP-glucose:(glucosyl)LPS alpha-1,3-glucosyltransferase